MKPTIQIPTNLYIYEVFDKHEQRWVLHTVLTTDQDTADMLTWRTFKTTYRLRKVVYGGDRRLKKQPGREAALARLVHVSQYIKN